MYLGNFKKISKHKYKMLPSVKLNFFQSLKIKIAPRRINNTAIVFFRRLVSLKIFPPITVAQRTDVRFTASVNATEARLIETICV
jgi:hypothetical protein